MRDGGVQEADCGPCGTVRDASLPAGSCDEVQGGAGTDEAGNEQEISEVIYQLDVDAPKAPIINASTGYPILTEYGVKFDDVLNNQQALLAMFNKELENPSTFLSNLITSQAADGKMTQLQLDSWLNTFKTTYSGVIDSNILDALTARTDSSGNLTINIGGDEVVNVSQSDAKALADALKAAIIQYGGGIVSVRK